MKWIALIVVAMLFCAIGTNAFAQSPKVELPVFDVLPLPEPSKPRWTVDDDVRQMRSQLALQTSLIRKLSLLVEDLLQRVETLEKSQLPRQVRKSDQSPGIRGRRRQSAESNLETVSP